MATTTISTRPFEFGRVFGNAFSAYGKNLGVYLGLSAIFVLAPHLIGSVILQSLGLSGSPSASGADTTVARFFEASLAGLFAYPLFGAVYAATIGHLRGDRVRFEACLATGLRYWAPLFAIGTISGLVAGFATLLLIVPGVIIGLMWSMAAPLKVIEDIPLMSTFAKSQALTRGRRWSVLGVILVGALISVGGAIVVSLIAGIVWGLLHTLAPGMASVTFAQVTPFAEAFMQWAIQPFGAALIVCVYAELRGLDADAGRVAATFE